MRRGRHILRATSATNSGRHFAAPKGDYMNIYLAGGVKGLTLFTFILGFLVICGVVFLYEYLKYINGGRKSPYDG